MRPGQWAALALVTLAGAAVRLVGPSETPLWTDEALTLVIVRSGYSDLLLGGIDPTGGLYYVLHKALIPEGAGLIGVRAISIASGTLLIPALFAAARSAAGVRAGLAAAALAAVFPPLVDYSEEARAYSLLLLTVGLSAWALIEWQGTRRFRHLVLFAAATVLALYSHPTSVVWVVASTAWLLAHSNGDRRRAYFAVALMLVLSVPEVVRIVNFAGQGGSFAWLGQESLAGAARILAEATLPLGWGRAGPGAGWVAAAAVLVWTTWRLASSRSEIRRLVKTNTTAAAAVAMLLLAPVGLWLLGFFGPPTLMLRTALLAALGAVIALAVLATAGQPAKACITQLAALVLLYGGSYVAGGGGRTTEPWDRVAAILAANARPGESVLACPYWRGPALYAALDTLERPLAAPVLLVHRGAVHQLIASGTAGWSDAYHRHIFAADWPRVEDSDAPRRWAEAEIRRLWLVDSGCPGVARLAIINWAGEGKWRRQSSIPSPDRGSDIAIVVFTPPAPLSKELWVPLRPPRSRTGR